MFEAAKNRFYPEVFSTEEAARRYIDDAEADDVRPWIRRTDVKPMIDSFIVIAGKDVPRRVPRP